MRELRAFAVGPDGNLYVSNQDDHDVNMFQGPNGKSPGAYIGHFAKHGINTLRGIACDGTYTSRRRTR